MTTYRSDKPRWRKGFLDKLESLFLDKLLWQKRKIALIRNAISNTKNTVCVSWKNNEELEPALKVLWLQLWKGSVQSYFMVWRVSRAWIQSASNVKYIQNQTQQGSIFSLLALCQSQKSSRFNCVSKVFCKVQVLIICSIYSCEMGVSLSLMLHQILYSYKPSSHASTHPHQSFLVVLFKLHVQYAPTRKIKRKTVKCLYWAFLCQLSIYGFQW